MTVEDLINFSKVCQMRFQLLINILANKCNNKDINFITKIKKVSI